MGRCSLNPPRAVIFQALKDVFQYEQTCNVMQVWIGKLSQLQLPVQNPARGALAQVCHTRIDVLNPDEYQFHLLSHQNSHHSQGTYPKRLNH